MNDQTTDKKNFIKALVLLLMKIAFIAVIFIALFFFVFGIARNDDMSMNPSIKDGDLVVYYRLSDNYIRNDVVVFEKDGETQIKRIAAVPGDTVDISDEGGILINGAYQQEPEIYEQTFQYEEGITFPITLREDEYFVLGDSREHATDSRIYGPIVKEQIKGNIMTLIRRRGL